MAGGVAVADRGKFSGAADVNDDAVVGPRHSLSRFVGDAQGDVGQILSIGSELAAAGRQHYFPCRSRGLLPRLSPFPPLFVIPPLWFPRLLDYRIHAEAIVLL